MEIYNWNPALVALAVQSAIGLKKEQLVYIDLQHQPPD